MRGRSAAAFSPDGARIVSGVRRTARCGCGTPPAAAELLVLRGHEGRGLCRRLLARRRARRQRRPGTARCGCGTRRAARSSWSCAAMRGRSTPPPSRPTARASSAASEDGTVRVWDAASGAELLVLRGHEGAVNAAAFSPDGARDRQRRPTDSTVRVWDAASGAELLVLRGHEGPGVERRLLARRRADRERRPRTARCGCGTRERRGAAGPARPRGRGLRAPPSRPTARAIVSGVRRTARCGVWDAASGAELAGPARPRGAGLGCRLLARRRADRQRRPGTARCGCGTRRAARSCWSCAATRGRSRPPPSRPRRAHRQRRPRTARCGCGTRRAAGSCWSCAATRGRHARRLLARRRADRQRRPRTGRCGCGTRRAGRSSGPARP